MTALITDWGPGWLFVPADRPDRYEKAVSASDLAIIDLEDAVSNDSKVEARTALLKHKPIPHNVCVRVNGFESGFLEDDLATIRQLEIRNIMLPMAELDQPYDLLADLSVIALIETPQGVLDAAQIAALPQVSGLALGSADLETELNLKRLDPLHSDPEAINFGRLEILYAAKAKGKQAIDSVWAAVGDKSGMNTDAMRGASLGFDAKLAIHPSQVDVIRKTFLPSSEEIIWAEKIITESKRRGLSTFVFDGELVDEAILKRARLLLNRMN